MLPSKPQHLRLRPNQILSEKRVVRAVTKSKYKQPCAMLHNRVNLLLNRGDVLVPRQGEPPFSSTQPSPLLVRSVVNVEMLKEALDPKPCFKQRIDEGVGV